MHSKKVRSAHGVSWPQLMIGIAGASLVFTGAALLFAPLWFYQTIGTFAPFNRHYAGDLGAFQVPLGIALGFAARHPARHRLLIWAAAGGSLLHALNHVYDALLSRASLNQWLAEPLPLLLFAVLLLGASMRIARAPKA